MGDIRHAASSQQSERRVSRAFPISSDSLLGASTWDFSALTEDLLSKAKGQSPLLLLHTCHFGGALLLKQNFHLWNCYRVADARYPLSTLASPSKKIHLCAGNPVLSFTKEHTVPGEMEKRLLTHGWREKKPSLCIEKQTAQTYFEINLAFFFS